MPVNHLNAQASAIVVSVHESYTFGKGVLLYNCIGIQKKNVFTLCQSHSLIIGFCKAYIVLILYQIEERKFLFQHLHRTIDGIVIHNEDFGIYIPDCILYRVQTVLEKVLYVIVYDDYG